MAGSVFRAPRSGGASSDSGVDLLAGATIVVEDAAAPPAVTRLAPPGGPGGREIPAGGAPLLSPPAPGTSGAKSLRLYAGGLLVLLCLGLFGWTVWRGREPVAVTVRPLAAATGAEIRVYVSGAVATPGVYRLLQGDRVDEAIRAAGGLTGDADGARLNLAQRVRDEQRLDVPFTHQPENAAGGGDSSAQAGVPPAATPRPRTGAAAPRATATPRPSATPRPAPTAKTEPTARPSATARAEPTARPTASPQPTELPGGKVNVNTATAAQLEKLPGLGEVSARRIVEYRATNGPILSLEQLRQAGISDAILRRAADYLAFDVPS